MSRKGERRERQTNAEDETLDIKGFLKLAETFIDVANKANKRINATDVHKAFLWAASRYNAHVARAVLETRDDDAFIAEMTKTYQDMLRQNLADPSLKPPA